MKFKLVEDLQDKYIYHACDKVYDQYNPLQNYGEGFHFCLDLEDLKLAMEDLKDKSIIVRYKLIDNLSPLQIKGDLGGWFSYDIAELLLANHEGRPVEDNYLIGDQPEILSEINLSDIDVEFLQNIKELQDPSVDSYYEVFSILNRYGYDSIEYDYSEGDTRSICIDDINHVDLSSAVKVFSKYEIQDSKAYRKHKRRKPRS